MGRTEALTADGVTVLNEGELRLHYFFRFEVEWMLEACGLQVDRLWGDFAKGEFAADSPEMIFVARRSE
jgi:hypothetical protein